MPASPHDVLPREEFNVRLLRFLQASPTPFHAVAEMARQLEAAGFGRLDEADAWRLEEGGRYYLTRGETSIVAFTAPGHPGRGLRLFGAHTDSPCLKIKPQPELRRHGCLQLGVEVYGGALLNPWFDRDLSLAGQVIVETSAGGLQGLLVDFGRPVACIPSLAIHLDREVNDKRSIDRQVHLPPVLQLLGVSGTSSDSVEVDFRKLLAEQVRRQYPQLTVRRVVDYDISCYDTQPPALTGLAEEFIAGARLDNLLSCSVGLQALLAAGEAPGCVLVCSDHEEVGSRSAVGAAGPLLSSVLGRMLPAPEALARAIDRSLLISADNAHALHPNYPDRHDANHGPRLNGGPVIKLNANQSYATSAGTAALFRRLCEKESVPVQSFVVRSDMACGSTIGPITAGAIGVRTADVGVPQWGMHSIRETAGSEDAHGLYRVARRFFRSEALDGPAA